MPKAPFKIPKEWMHCVEARCLDTSAGGTVLDVHNRGSHRTERMGIGALAWQPVCYINLVPRYLHLFGSLCAATVRQFVC